MKTNAQKVSIPRADRCGCFGNWITGKKYAVYVAATAEFAGASSISPSWTRKHADL